MTTSLKIENDFGEKLDVLVEGNEQSPELIVFVHGYGTDKDEGFASFIDLSNAFQDKYLNIRYDQSGYGKSEGKDEAFHLQKAAGDLKSILRWLAQKYPEKRVNIIAHSLGTFVVLLLSPTGIKHVVLTSIPNADTSYLISQLQSRIVANGGELDEDGITTYPRNRGRIQLIGRDFWRTIRNLKPAESLLELGEHSQVMVLKPLHDDVLGNENFEPYKTIKTVKYLEINGDHNFTNLTQRQKLIEKISQFLGVKL